MRRKFCSWVLRKICHGMLYHCSNKNQDLISNFSLQTSVARKTFKIPSKTFENVTYSKKQRAFQFWIQRKFRAWNKCITRIVVSIFTPPHFLKNIFGNVSPKVRTHIHQFSKLFIFDKKMFRIGVFSKLKLHTRN